MKNVKNITQNSELNFDIIGFMRFNEGLVHMVDEMYNNFMNGN